MPKQAEISLKELFDKIEINDQCLVSKMFGGIYEVSTDYWLASTLLEDGLIAEDVYNDCDDFGPLGYASASIFPKYKLTEEDKDFIKKFLHVFAKIQILSSGSNSKIIHPQNMIAFLELLGGDGDLLNKFEEDRIKLTVNNETDQRDTSFIPDNYLQRPQ